MVNEKASFDYIAGICVQFVETLENPQVKEAVGAFVNAHLQRIHDALGEQDTSVTAPADAPVEDKGPTEEGQ